MPLVHHRRRPSHVVVQLRGELTDGRAGRVSRRLSKALARGPDTLRLDLGKVTFLAPTTGAVILHAAADARRAGVRLSISPASSPSMRVLRKLGIDSLLDSPPADR